MRWSYAKSYFWEEAPFFRLVLPLIIGILSYDTQIIPSSFYISLFIIACLALIAIIIGYIVKSVEAGWDIGRTIAINMFIFCIAWLCCWQQDIRNDASWFGNHVEAKAFVAQVMQPPTERERTWKVNLAITHSIDSLITNKVCGNTTVYFYKSTTPFLLHQGDEIIIPNQFALIKNAGNPFEFDYTTFARHNNLFYQQFLSSDDILITSTKTTKSNIVQRIHNYSMDVLQQFVKDKPTLGLLQAMLLGDEVNFDDEQRQLYVDTGIIHVVAISGGHVMFLFLIVYSCFFWMKKKEKYQWVIYLTALPIVWLYVFIAGAPTSAIRSVVMFSLLALGFFIGKKGTALNQLFATAFILLLVQPMWLFSVGFQLSFLAVLSLIIFYKNIFKLWIPSNRFVRKLWGVATMSISAEILIAPLVIFYFHSFPVGFLFANIIAWLMMSFVMTGGLMIIVFAKLKMIAKALSVLVCGMVGVFNWLLQYLQLLNPTSFRFLHLNGIELVVVYALIGSLTVFLIKRYKPIFFIAAALVVILLSMLCVDEWSALHHQKLVVYNIGKINHTELINGKKHLVITKSIADTTAKKIAFATKEAYVNWQSWKSDTSQFSSELFQINQQKILILNAPLLLDTTSVFPVDYILINYPLKSFTGNDLQQAFHCKKIIVGSNQKRKTINDWRDNSLKYNVPLHAVTIDGAFVLE